MSRPTITIDNMDWVTIDFGGKIPVSIAESILDAILRNLPPLLCKNCNSPIDLDDHCSNLGCQYSKLTQNERRVPRLVEKVQTGNRVWLPVGDPCSWCDVHALRRFEESVVFTITCHPGQKYQECTMPRESLAWVLEQESP